jgi:hypothetical protein
MNEVDDRNFEERLRKAMTARPEPQATRQLAQRAMARATAKCAVGRHVRWARWSSIGAAILIILVIAGVAVFAPDAMALWSGELFSSSASTVSSSSSQISGSLLWMLMGFGMVAMCVLILTVWRVLAGEEGNAWSLALVGW